ncbi:hypothetical protein DFH09DRAFT_1339679 [Mycena vulgaris]|nr:hypothetical protein DFH09DRAFT_1339679 [Mycena vulgaris]
MKLVAILVSFGFSGSVLALNNSSHPEIVAAISSLGDQVSEISSILGALPGLYSATGRLIKSIEDATDALQVTHGTFSEDDADEVFLEMKKIEPVITAMVRGILAQTDPLGDFRADGIPVTALGELQALGPAVQTFHLLLGANHGGTASYSELFSHATEAYQALVSSCTSRFSWSTFHSSPNTSTRGLSRLLGYTSIVVSTLSDVSDLFDVPAFHTIAGPTLMVLETAQSVKIHKEQCGVMLERGVDPDILDRISILAETIQKVQMKRPYQIQDCIFRFDGAIEDFRIITTSMVGNMVTEMQADIVARQNQIIELIQDSADSETASSVTMRGVERPGGVRWTRPFLPALDPVDSTAAREIYVDIADEPVDEDEDAQVQELLSLTDNLPLAITLLANIASFEGVSATLNRYRLETTAMLSEGYDKRSNLHKSIMLSLGSWRLRAVPDATTLLAVLSLLPDGVSPSQLYRCGTDIEEIGRCKSTLIRTSLAFLRPDGRLSVLTPIREYMQKFHPASRDTVKPWKAYLGDLLLDWASQRDLVSTQLADSITDNLGNIRSLVHYSFSDDDTTMRGIGYDILRLDAFLYDIYRGSTDLFSSLQEIIEKTGDATLEGLRICGLLERHIPKINQSDAEALVSRGLHLFRTTFDPVGEAQLYNSAAEYYSRARCTQQATRFNELALALPNSGDLPRFKAVMYACRDRIFTGKHHDDVPLAAEGSVIARRLGNFRLESNALQIQATLCASTGQLSRALILCDEARRLLVACGLQHSTGELAIIDVEAFVHFQRTDYMRSREAYARIMRVASPAKFSMFYVHSVMQTIHLDMLMGHDARELLDRLDSVVITAERNAFIHAIWYCDLVRAEIKHREMDRKGATNDYRRCLELFRSTDVWGVTVCFEHLSDVYLEEKDLNEAFRWVVSYLAQSRKTGVIQTVQALRRIGDVFIATGDNDTAVALYTVALEAFTGMDVNKWRDRRGQTPGKFYRAHGGHLIPQCESDH